MAVYLIKVAIRTFRRNVRIGRPPYSHVPAAPAAARPMGNEISM